MTKQKKQVKEISEDEFSEWKDSRVTARLFEMFQVEVETARINIVGASGTAQERGEISLRNAPVAAICEAFINMDKNYLNTPLYMEVD